MDILEQAADIADRSGGGLIPSTDVDALREKACGRLDQLMLALIPLAKGRAHPALSKFQVGAIAEGASGTLYFGANFEFADCPVNQTVHAEQAAVINAACNRETGIRRLAVSAAPCGYCRQFLYELVGADELSIILECSEPTPLPHYLPAAFGPNDLGIEAGLLSRQDHRLQFADQSLAQGSGAEEALASSNASYAPYTGAFGAAAIATRGGRIFAAPYLENAAFNPSCSPLQSAIVSAVLAGTRPEDFTGICVAQKTDSKIDHAAAAQWVSKSISPGIEVRKIPLKSI